MTTAKPSLELLRELSDEHVLHAFMAGGRLTRAELAARTGISKPTVGESVRRLTAAGLLVDTGERTTGRGRVGSYYALADAAGRALAVSISPEGVVAELVDAHGSVVARAAETVTRPASPAQATDALAGASRRVLSDADAPVRLGVVSAADPVDRATGRLVHLPDSPFLLGELAPAETLADLVDGPVLVDNDVHWAARAERAARSASGGDPLDDFVYLYLGEGLGAAVVSDGEVRRGSRGIAGEISHVPTTGPGGRAVFLIDVFAELGLRHPGSTAIDVAALLAAVDGDDDDAHRRTRAVIGAAVAGVVSAAVALSDPAEVVVGGTWGPHPPVLDAVRAACDDLRRPVAIRAAVVTQEAALAGARETAVRELRSVITNYRRTLASA